MVEHRFLYAVASEPELNDLVSGRTAGVGRAWPFRGMGFRQTAGTIGVLWKEPSADEPLRPLALIVDAGEQRRLFARFAQVRSDLSPLSSWCHIISPNLFATLDEPLREPTLGGFEASWAGLAIAEAAVLSGRAVPQLKLAACLATQTYAVARTLSLWPGISAAEVLGQFGNLQRDIRTEEIHDLGRSNFSPLWNILASVSVNYESMPDPYGRIANAVISLKRAREVGLDDAMILEREFDHLPEATFLSGLVRASPEDRLKVFDALVRKVGEDRSSAVRRIELTFLAGYLATVAAGGEASLGLASSVTRSAPEILGWAYLIGGLGERVTWSGGFSGLGRLVARELMRPFRLDDPPSVDFAAEEARVLVDKQLADPLVHLQLKQSRVATAALFPGVNLQVPFVEQPPESRRQPESRRPNEPINAPQASAAEEALQSIAKALTPMILDQVREQLLISRDRGTKGGWKRGPQRKLPLTGDE